MKFLPIFLILCFVSAFDFYIFQTVKLAFSAAAPRTQFIVALVYWSFTILMGLAFVYIRTASGFILSRPILTMIFASFSVVYISKFVVFIFLVLEDASRLIAWLGINGINIFKKEPILVDLSRKEFLSKLSLLVGAIPFSGLLYGVVKGGHKYTVHKVSLKIKALQKEFEGLKIVQISDIHAGSFYNKKSVEAGVEKLMALKPDLVFFTGDLVNNFASEIKDYLDVFAKVKAPMGVFSILGNHDYGDYAMWNSLEDKQNNLKQLIESHQMMGWDILLDEHRILKKGENTLAVVGIQNWGNKGNFPKYGNLKKALEGCETEQVHLLLSHDPSHWEGQVLKEFPQIDVMFAGHTHGMQFGIEIPGLKWSPVQYMYKQWAGLYQKGHQQLYVNRGFGFIGFPGRVGIYPEITLFTLEKSDS